MPGRPLPSEDEMGERGFGRPDMARRRVVLRESLNRFATAEPPDRFHNIAAQNIAHWRDAVSTTTPQG